MADSEMRQRKGQSNDTKVSNSSNPEEALLVFHNKIRAAMETKVRNNAAPGVSETEIQQKINEGVETFFAPKKKPLSGISNATRDAKEALQGDPYNLEEIFNLGDAYIKEEKWREAANVLIRGWKRVGELKLPTDRFLFLLQLTLASFECSMYRQANAVMMDIEEPEDPELAKEYLRWACKVHAMNGNLQKALKTFNKSIEGCQDLDEGLHVYVDAIKSLKHCGALDAARSSLEKLAKNDDDKGKIKVVETVAEMKNAINDTADEQSGMTGFQKALTVGVVTVSIVLFVWLLHFLESKSLETLKLTDKLTDKQ